MAACIVETTSLKLDKIAAGHPSETAHTLATIAHWTLIKDSKCACLYSTNGDLRPDLCEQEVSSVQRGALSFTHAQKNISLNILLWLRCSVTTDPTLDDFVRCRYTQCVLVLLFRRRFLVLVGLSEHNFGIRMVVTGPIIARRFHGYWIRRPRQRHFFLIGSTRHTD
jgi:hypothetical protein